jgi:hypothetical protein
MNPLVPKIKNHKSSGYRWELPCGRLHREYGPAITGIDFYTEDYYLFGIKVTEKLWTQIYHDILLNEEDCEMTSLAFARLLVPHLKPNEIEELKKALSRYYSEELAENICLIGSL